MFPSRLYVQLLLGFNDRNIHDNLEVSSLNRERPGIPFSVRQLLLDSSKLLNGLHFGHQIRLLLLDTVYSLAAQSLNPLLHCTNSLTLGPLSQGI